jgi:hypothetical protein
MESVLQPEGRSLEADPVGQHRRPEGEIPAYRIYRKD